MGDPLELLAGIEDYVARAVAPLVKRIQQLETERARNPERGEKGEDGAAAEVDYDRMGEIVVCAVQKEVGKYPVPKDGRDGEPGRDAPPIDYAHVHEMVKAAALKVAADLPQAKDGDRGEAGKDGVAGRDGKDIDDDAVVARVLAAIPMPKDGLAGKDADEAAIIAKVLASIPIPKDGLPGKDGRDGVDGKDGRDGQRGPPGEGLQGEPGRDALDGLASIEAALRGERTLALDFLMTGGNRKSFEFRLPIPIYRGIHKDGVRYEQGDGVTRDGSTWIATKDTDTPPPSGDWILAVKKGRDLR